VVEYLGYGIAAALILTYIKEKRIKEKTSNEIFIKASIFAITLVNITFLSFILKTYRLFIQYFTFHLMIQLILASTIILTYILIKPTQKDWIYLYISTAPWIFLLILVTIAKIIGSPIPFIF